MSLPIRCAECGHPMLQLPDYDVCDNGACDFVGVPIENESDDPPPLDWLDELGSAA